MKELFKEIFSKSSELSSKRISGAFGWLVFCLVLINLVLFSVNVTPECCELLNTLAYTSVVLISGGTIETIISNKSNKK